MASGRWDRLPDREFDKEKMDGWAKGRSKKRSYQSKTGSRNDEDNDKMEGLCRTLAKYEHGDIRKEVSTLNMLTCL